MLVNLFFNHQSNVSGSLSLAELSCVISKSGGDYIYIKEAWGNVPSFMHCWMSTLLLRPAALGITCQAFAKYCLQPFFLYCPIIPTIPVKLLALGACGRVPLIIIDCHFVFLTSYC